MKQSQNLDLLLQNIFEDESLISASLSSPLAGLDHSKAAIRPVLLNGKILYQLTFQKGKQALHNNLSARDCIVWLTEHAYDYKQIQLYTTSADFHLLSNKRGQLTILKKRASKSSLTVFHNRQKKYVLQEGSPVPFLVHLGIMNSQGKISAGKRDKFRQLNRFLEMIEDVIPHLDSSRTLRIVDFGCGKAYLTFALHHFLKANGYRMKITGIDLKHEVIQFCEAFAHDLGIQEEVKFIAGDVNTFEAIDEVDLVVSLHLCDTATDAALEKAVRWKSQVILCVPCCQHELMRQVRQESLAPLLKHGILKERFAALATDAARVQLLEVLGYHAQIMEFIDTEHTPKNLLIRAYKKKDLSDRQHAWESYLKFKKELQIDPSLERRFSSVLPSEH